MQVPVRIERVHDNGFRAHTGEPFCLSAEGPTRHDALSALRGQIESKIQAAEEIVILDIPFIEHPLARFAGDMKGDPLFGEWQEAIAEYRRSVDADQNSK